VPAVSKALLLALALLCAACGREGPQAAHDASRLLGAACSADAQCGSDFCDRQTCAAPNDLYGRRCRPAPRVAGALRDGKLNACGAYVCEYGRCRSCASVRQCRDEYGAPACKAVPAEPGLRCGR
jgi:hypothetical protein